MKSNNKLTDLIIETERQGTNGPMTTTDSDTNAATTTTTATGVTGEAEKQQ